MNPFTTLKKGIKVGIVKKVASMNSNIRNEDVGKVFSVTGMDYGGRRHNRYIACVYLQSNEKKRRAVVSELASVNPNFEPDGEFIVCVGCGATISELDLQVKTKLRGIKACPSCGMLEPHES